MDKIFTKYKEIIIYVVFGLLTTVVSWLSYALFANVFGLRVFFSNLFSWIFAVSFAFVTNKLWVFESKTWNLKVVTKEAAAFFSSRIFTGVIEILSVPLLVKTGIDSFFTSVFQKLHLGFSFLMTEGMCSKIAVSVIVIILNYVLSKMFVFKGAKRTEKPGISQKPVFLSDFFYKIANAAVMGLLLMAAFYAISASDTFFGGGSAAASKEAVILFSAVLLFFVFFFNKKVVNTAQFDRYYKPVLILLFVLLAIGQIVMLCGFDVEQITDSYMINDQALSIVLNGQSQAEPGNVYFQIYSNNDFTLVLTVLFYKVLRLFGADLQSNLPFAIANTLFTDLSVALSFLAVKRVMGKKSAVGFLFFNVLNPLTYLFVYWNYTMV